VVPREARTSEILVAAKAQVDEFYRQHKHLPAALPDNWIDAFEQPLVWQLEPRAHGGTSYTIMSLGYDRRRSGDDLCARGTTGTLARLKSALARIDLEQTLATTLHARRPTLVEGVGQVRALRCD